MTPGTRLLREVCTLARFGGFSVGGLGRPLGPEWPFACGRICNKVGCFGEQLTEMRGLQAVFAAASEKKIRIPGDNNQDGTDQNQSSWHCRAFPRDDATQNEIGPALVFFRRLGK